MKSTYITKDSPENLSIKFENLYAVDGKIKYFTVNNAESVPIVNTWLTTHTWAPEIVRFDSDQSINNYIQTFSDIVEVELAILNDNFYYENIGHAMWDGFYPAYLAALKFGYDKENFCYLTTDFSNTKVMSYKIMETFFGIPRALNYKSLENNKLIHFKTLISGNGTAGNVVMTQDYTLYGKPYDGVAKFKSRMYERYNLQSNKPLGKRAIIINNKRFGEREMKIINEVIDHYSTLIDIKFIDWRNYSSFREQLKEIENVDIHISGPGTAMMYMPFLKKGAVNINLGYMERTQTNSARPNIFIKDCKYEDYIFPGWMEQSVCAGADYVSTLYYDRYNYNNLETSQFIKIIDSAITLLDNKIILENNLNKDAEIFKEYCRLCGHADKICNHLTNIAFFIEMFVAEHPKAVEPSFVNIKLLKELKEKYNYNKYSY